MRERKAKSVAAGDRAKFTKLMVAEFESLHPGNAVRFGLRPPEFEAWLRKTGRTGN